MKKIIDGKRYDTETATLIASWDNGYFGNDFKRCEEDLYRTERGSWFIYGEGGPMSKYVQATGPNSYIGGEDITPLSADEARQWLEDTGNYSEMEEYFADQVEDA